jgi:hypothetical protein
VKGCLRIGLPIIILVVLAIYCAFPHPISNQTKLKAIAAESRLLMATHPIKAPERWADVPEDQWPPAIASLHPELVVVHTWGVDILVKPFFDGGWGYHTGQSKQHLPMLEGCYSEVSQGVFWHGPC